MSHRLASTRVLTMFLCTISKFASSIQRSAQADPAPAPDGEANQKPEAVLPFFFFFDALERFARRH